MSHRLAWGKFDWDDWETDPGLRLCSPGAQALWMRMLCMASKEGGYVKIAGSAATPEDIAQYVAWPLDSVRSWLAELEARRVYSIARGGVIYSRRMVRDAHISRTNRNNGKLGGNPTLRKDKGNSGSLKAEKKREESESERISVANATVTDVASKPETPAQRKARLAAEQEKARTDAIWARVDGAIDVFWQRYPRKVGQSAMARSFRTHIATLLRQGEDDPIVIILGGLDRAKQFDAGRALCTRLPPAGWLKAGHYRNEYSPETPNDRRSQKLAATEDNLVRAFAGSEVAARIGTGRSDGGPLGVPDPRDVG